VDVPLPKAWASVVNPTVDRVKGLLLGVRDGRKAPAHPDASSSLSALLLLPRRISSGVLACALMPPRLRRKPKLLPQQLPHQWAVHA
jgi:hypothetical protein